MKISPLHFKLRIKATAFDRGEVKKAKISYIRQEGLFKQGHWGLANKKLPKIYILRSDKEVIYVGITRMSLSSRFRYGLSASGRGGFHGYAWKKLANKGESDLIDLLVYLFKDKEKTETIEAEIVYLIRNKTGKWPRYQTEIHFHQADAEEIKIAQHIHKQVFNQLN